MLSREIDVKVLPVPTDDISMPPKRPEPRKNPEPPPPFQEWAKQVEIYTEPLLIGRIGEHREEMEAPLECLSGMLHCATTFCRNEQTTLDQTHDVWRMFNDTIPYLKEELGVKDTKLLEGIRDELRGYLDRNGWKQGKSQSRGG